MSSQHVLTLNSCVRQLGVAVELIIGQRCSGTKTTLVLAYPHSSSRQEHSCSHFGSGPFQYEQTASTTVLDS